MTTQFPQPTNLPTVLASILTLLAVVFAIGLAATLRRKPVQNDGLLWLLAVFIVTVLFGTAVQPVEGECHYAWRGLQMVWLIGALACVIGIVRHVQYEKPSQAGVSFMALLGIGAIAVSTISLEISRGEARFHQCRIHLKTLAIVMAHDRNFLQPGPAVVGAPPRSWRVELLPFLEGYESPANGLAPRELYEKYVKSEPWDAEANLEISRTPIRMYQCPAATPDRNDLGRMFSSYALVTGPGTIFETATPRPFVAIADGLDQTALLVEACGRGIVWTEPRDIDIAQETLGINQPGQSPVESPSVCSSFHRRGVNVLFASGSVRTLSLNTDPQVLKALLTKHEP